MHILVVDDKEPEREKVGNLLFQLGFTFEFAINGLDALEKAQKQQYNLYIIDHLMPVMNGIKLVKNLKSKDDTSNIPIIFMSTQGISTFQNAEELMHLECIISKPIDPELFSQKINQLLIEKSVVHSL
jgi:two-component system, chemotaxis family, chemotaxis protein CheY